MNTFNDYGVLPVLNEYETAIQTLTNEVDYYAEEHEKLKKELLILINENRTLSQSLNELLKSQSNHKCETPDIKLIENEFIQNLKAQLGLAQKEKDTVILLWQAALKNVDHLEDSLDFYEGRTHSYVSKKQVSEMKTMYENKIDQLKEQVEQCHTDLNHYRKSLDIKNVELLRTVENPATQVLAQHLEDDVQQLNRKLKDIMKMRDKLQANLYLKNQVIAELQTKDIEAKRKVSEALQIVEAACFEKDAALARENDAKEEVIQISKALTEIIDETTEKVKTETDVIKQAYNNKLKRFQDDMLHLQKELNEKNTELTKCLHECKLLNEQLVKINTGHICVEDSHTSKLLILEKNLESTFQKLLLSEKKNLQLDAEKESIKSDLQQMANCYKNDIKIRDTEKEVMKKQLKTLKVQLHTSNTNVVEAANKADKLKAQLKHLDAVIKEKLKLQQTIHDEALSKSIEGIKSNSTQIQNELQHHVQLQRGLKKKIKKEMVDIINELEKRMGELRDAKKSLQKNLKEVMKDNLYYKENLKHFCTKVINLADVNSEISANLQT